MSHAYNKTNSSPVARAFVDARRAGRFLSPYPGTMPATLAEAYEIQDEAIAAWPDRIAGWKLGRIREPLDQQYGAGHFHRNVHSERGLRDVRRLCARIQQGADGAEHSCGKLVLATLDRDGKRGDAIASRQAFPQSLDADTIRRDR